MKPLLYRDVLRSSNHSTKVFADWLNELRNGSGAYVIRKKSNHEILYVGESHSGRLAKTVKRHFYRWKDTEDRKHFTTDPAAVDVAVRLTPPDSAVGAQNNLIDRLKPTHNEQIPF